MAKAPISGTKVHLGNRCKTRNWLISLGRGSEHDKGNYREMDEFWHLPWIARQLGIIIMEIR